MSALVTSSLIIGEEAWYQADNHLENPPATTAEALKLAGLDWEVEEFPLITPVHASSTPYTMGATAKSLIDGKDLTIDGWKCLKRSDNDAVLHVCRDTWTPLQNQKAFEFFDPILQGGDAQLSAAVGLSGGKRIAITAKITGAIGDVVKDDPVEEYLVLYNAHDGSLALGIMFTPTM